MNATGPPKFYGYVVGSKPLPDRPETVIWKVKVQSHGDFKDRKFTVDQSQDVSSWIAPGRNVVFELVSVGKEKKLVAINVRPASIKKAG